MTNDNDDEMYMIDAKHYRNLFASFRTLRDKLNVLIDDENASICDDDFDRIEYAINDAHYRLINAYEKNVDNIDDLNDDDF
jgi:hypothetical protein